MNLMNKILKNMPKELTDLEKARYIYIELCNELYFSTKFQNTDSYNFSKMYTAKVDATNLKSAYINCKMWSQIYSQLLDEIGIKNEMIDQGHRYVEFYINGKKMIADATGGNYTDLARVKNHDETENFGYSVFQNPDIHNKSINITEQNKKELKKIDEKLGYNNDDKKKIIKFKEFLMAIKNKTFDIKKLDCFHQINDENELCFKLEYLFSSLGKLNNGYYESKNFVHQLEMMLLNSEEQRKVGAVELKRTNKNKSVDIVQCIYAENGNGKQYYLLSPNLPIKKFEPEQIQALAVKGYGVEKDIPGINFPKRFVPGVISCNIKYRLYRKMIKLNIIKPKNIDLYAKQQECKAR